MNKGLYLTFLFSSICFSQKKISLSSPNGKVQFQFEFKNDAPYYKVKFGDQVLIDESPLRLIFNEGELEENLKLGKPKCQEVDTTYSLVMGKTSEAHNHYKEVIRSLTGNELMMVNMAVRAFNDGVGYRYEFPEQEWKYYELVDEMTTINISGNPTVHSMFWGSYTTSHEAFYHVLSFNEIPQDTLLEMPGMFNSTDNAYLSITEANLRNYAGI